MLSDTTPPIDDDADSRDTDNDKDLEQLMTLARDPARWPELQTRLARLLRVEGAAALLRGDPTGEDEPTCSLCGELVDVPLGDEWEDGMRCHPCLVDIAGDIQTALSQEPNDGKGE